MIDFIKSRFIDLILCLLMSLGMIFPLFSGFVLDDMFSNSLIATALMTSAILFIYTLFSYNKKTVMVGIVIAFILMVGTSIYLARNAILANEADNSLTVSLVIIFLVSFLVFLANSNQKSLIVLFLMGSIVIATASFLKFPVEVPSIIVFDFSVLLALWYSTYKNSLSIAQSGTIQSYQYILQSSIIAFIIIGLCSGIYFGIVQPMNPPTRELKLIEKMQNMDILKQLGIFSQYDQFDPHLLSQMISQDHVKGNEMGEEENKKDGQDENNEIKENEDNQTNGLTNEMVKKIRYQLKHFIIPWVAIIIICFMILYAYLQYYLKKQWEQKINELSYENQIINYYHYFLKRLDRTKLKRIKTDTLKEYSQKMDYELSRFSTDIQFSYLTDIYMKVYYGQNNATKQDVQIFQEYYQIFLKGLKKEIGIVRYYIKRLTLRI